MKLSTGGFVESSLVEVRFNFDAERAIARIIWSFFMKNTGRRRCERRNRMPAAWEYPSFYNRQNRPNFSETYPTHGIISNKCINKNLLENANLANDSCWYSDLAFILVGTRLKRAEVILKISICTNHRLSFYTRSLIAATS